jgi:hypothetical protein
MKTPCLGTPQDIEKIIDAGHGDRIKATDWAVGIMLGVTSDIVKMYQAQHLPFAGCTFFNEGLCQLHDKGLKPTEGRLSHHSVKVDNYNHRKHISWNVAKEWLNPDNAEVIKRIEQKLNNLKQLNTND